MATMIHNIKAKLVELDAEMQAIRDAVEKDQRLLTADEQSRMEKAQADHAALTTNIKLLAGGEDITNQLAKPQPRVDVSARPAMSVTAGSPWKSLGMYAMDVRRAEFNPAVRERLMNAASAFSSEGTAADGGYTVPNDLRREIQAQLFGSPESLLNLCDIQRSFSNTMVFPRDTEQDWQLTVTGSYTAEGADLPENKVGVGQVSVSCGKVGHIINATEELINDSLSFDSYLASKGYRGLVWNVNTQIISGSGANNLPTGFLAHGALLTVSASQPTGSYTANQKVLGDDILTMYYSMPAPYRSSAVWVLSPDIEPQLVTAKFSGSTLYTMPGSAMNPTDTGKIYGRPVIVHPYMKAPGAVGDIAFCYFGKYLAFLKSDVQASFTPYLYWKSDTLSWKFEVRLGGRPWFDAPVSLPTGKKLSPFIALQGGR